MSELLIFIAASLFLIQATRPLTRCHAPAVYSQQPANITCLFNRDVSQTQMDFTVYRYDRNNRYEVVLHCFWEETGQLNCKVSGGYKFDRKITSTSVLNIPNATKEYEGRYVCQVIPSDPADLVSCNFTVEDLLPDNKTINANSPSGNEQDSNAATIGGFFAGVVLLCGTVVVMFIVCRKRKRFGLNRSGQFNSNTTKDAGEEPAAELAHYTISAVDGKENADRSAKLTGVEHEQEVRHTSFSVNFETTEESPLLKSEEEPKPSLLDSRGDAETETEVPQVVSVVTKPSLTKTGQNTCGTEQFPADPSSETEIETEDCQTATLFDASSFREDAPKPQIKGKKTEQQTLQREEMDELREARKNTCETGKNPVDARGGFDNRVEDRQAGQSTYLFQENVPRVLLIRPNKTEESTLKPERFPANASGATETGEQTNQSVPQVPPRGYKKTMKMSLQPEQLPAASSESPSRPQDLNVSLSDAKKRSSKTEKESTELFPAASSSSDETGASALSPLLRKTNINQLKVTNNRTRAKGNVEDTSVKVSGAGGNSRSPPDPPSRPPPPGDYQTVQVKEKQNKHDHARRSFGRHQYNTRFKPTPTLNPTELFLACKAGDKEKVQAVCNSTNVNSAYSNDETLLHVASRYGHTDLVVYLWSMDANIHQKDRNGWTPLHTASCSGAVAVVAFLLERKSDINARANDGSTPLHLACMTEKFHTASSTLDDSAECTSVRSVHEVPPHKLKTKHDAISAAELPGRGGTKIPQIAKLRNDVNAHAAATKEEGRELHAINRHEAVVECLVFSKSDVNAYDAHQRTPLHVACSSGNGAMVKMLLEAGANVETRDRVGRTPLHLASFADSAPIVNHLLDAGANINEKDDSGCTPLQLASRADRRSVVQILRDAESRPVGSNKQESLPVTPWRSSLAGKKHMHYTSGNAQVGKGDGRSLLHLASQKGKVSEVEHLLRTGANINGKDSTGNTPLHLACKAGKEPVVKVLVNARANVEAADGNGRTPLHVVCQTSSVSLAKLLLEARASTEAKDGNYCTPLHVACQSGSPSVVEVLLGARANIETKDDNDRTPLHVACQTGSLSLVKLLLGANANIKSKDRNRSTPLHVACTNNETSVVDSLLLAGANIEARNDNGYAPLHVACAYGNSAVVDMLLNRSANVDARDSVKRVPLHVASETDNGSVVKRLVDAGAHVEAEDDEGRTPLHVACKTDLASIVKLLLENGAKTESTDTNGCTPLHLACESGRAPVVKHLLSHGASIGAKNCIGQTPLDIARDRGKKSVCRVLLDANR